MSYRLDITGPAEAMLKAISDRRVQRQLIARMRKLTDEPEKQGYPLRGPLREYRSCRAVGQRYRIVYKINEGELVVLVVAAGIRKEGDRRDVYALARRLVRLGLID